MKDFSWRISKMPSQAVSHAQTCHPETFGQNGLWAIGYVELDHLKKVQRIEILIQSEHFFSRLVIMAKNRITRQRAFISKGNRIGDLNG